MKHPQADVLIAIANGEQVQYQNTDGEWIDTQPNSALGWLSEEWAVRIKPKTVVINGIEMPEPVREPLEVGQWYWIPEPSDEELFSQTTWRNDRPDHRYLERGLVHLSKEAAVAHARALLSFTEVKK